MKVYKKDYFCMVQTPFDAVHDLVQIFRGTDLAHSASYNGQVDFQNAGLVIRDRWDPFHFDVPFSISMDEAPPAIINGHWIGGGHGDPCCVGLEAKAHGKTLSDIGSVWKDEQGVTFTLLRVDTENHLLFVSENLGSLEDYKFKLSIEGALTYVSHGENTESIPADGKQTVMYLARAYKFTEKRIIAIKDGKEEILQGSCECDSIRIEEAYLLRNPATVAPALTAARPEGGFTHPQDLADYGETMLRHRMYYHVLGDGTVLCDFDVEKTMDVRFELWMGVMHQEKQNAFGGFVHRRIPKTVPLQLKDGTFDFNTPICLERGFYPESKPRLTPNTWENPASPPDREVDYFRDPAGHDRAAFACGYLPIFDGAPAKRLEKLPDAAFLNNTRKYYPTFMSGDITSARGIAYKKYFATQHDRASFYTVPYAGKTYIFADIIEENTLEIPVSGKVSVYEKSDSISYEMKNNLLTVSGNQGYLVCICE